MFKCIVGECKDKGVGQFKRKSDLARHMLKHKGDSFTCTECGKVWASAKEMYDHSMRVHRPHLNCKNNGKGCGYKTKEKKLFIKHERKCSM